MTEPLYCYPPEKHLFEGDGNDFLCSVCRRPRAMHYLDGFHALPFVSQLPTDPGLYRGPHPRYRIPGRLPPHEEPVFNAKRWARVKSEMRSQAANMDRILQRISRLRSEKTGELDPAKATVAPSLSASPAETPSEKVTPGGDLVNQQKDDNNRSLELQGQSVEVPLHTDRKVGSKDPDLSSRAP